MANVLYNSARESFIRGEIAWHTDDIKVVLVDTALYVVNPASDQFLDDIPGGAIVATSSTLTGRTTTGGVADANNPTFVGLTGATIEAVIFFQDTGVPGTSRLILYVDTGAGLPYTPSGGNLTLEWSDGISRIFGL